MRYAGRGAMKALPFLAALGAALHGQVIRTVPYNLVRLDPALDSIITADSPLEVLGEHFGLTEGPYGSRMHRAAPCCLAIARRT